MASRKPVKNPPAHFHTRLLGGEPPLDFATAKRLCELAARFAARAPWKRLDETNLILAQPPGAPEPHACSVMGALGQSFALWVYPGHEGLRVFRYLQSKSSMEPQDYLAAVNCVSVEIVPRKELQKEDRELLAAAGHPAPAGAPVPQFRSKRPGYLPWFINGAEGSMLAECLEATEAVFEREAGKPRFWTEEGVYPRVARAAPGGPFEITEVTPPFELPPPEAAPPVDTARVAAILESGPKRGGIWELGHFYDAAGIGRPGERKIAVHPAIAMDQRTAQILHAHVFEPRVSTAELLTGTFLQAAENAGALPGKLLVAERSHVKLLAPLAGALGVEVSAAGTLPAFEFIKSHMLKSFLRR